MKQICLVAVLFVLQVGSAGGLWGQSRYVKTTVCRVLDLGSANRVLEVRLDADVMADHMHAALLTDGSCPGVGLWLGISPKNADPSVAKFDDVLWSDGRPGFGGRKLSGTFFGKLRIGEKNPLNPKRRKISIALIRVENLIDVPTSTAASPSNPPPPPSSSPK